MGQGASDGGDEACAHFEVVGAVKVLAGVRGVGRQRLLPRGPTRGRRGGKERGREISEEIMSR